MREPYRATNSRSKSRNDVPASEGELRAVNRIAAKFGVSSEMLSEMFAKRPRTEKLWPPK